MAAGTWTFTNGGRTKLLDGTFDIDTDTWKMALFLSTSNIGAASTTYAGVTNEVANAFGYTTGGIAITLTLAGTTTVTVDIATDPVWTASVAALTLSTFAPTVSVAGGSASVTVGTAALTLTTFAPDLPGAVSEGRHAVGPRLLRQRRELIQPVPVSVSPITAGLAFTTLRPIVTVNDDDLVLALAA